MTHPIRTPAAAEWRTYADHAPEVRRAVEASGYDPRYRGPGCLWRLARIGGEASTAGDLEVRAAG